MAGSNMAQRKAYGAPPNSVLGMNDLKSIDRLIDTRKEGFILSICPVRTHLPPALAMLASQSAWVLGPAVSGCLCLI